LEAKGIPSKKQYNLWIMDVNYGRELSEYMMANTKMSLKFLIHFLIRKISEEMMMTHPFIIAVSSRARGVSEQVLSGY